MNRGLLPAAALAFWAYNTGQWIVALVLAAAMLAPAFTRTRWAIGEGLIRRVIALTVLALLILLAGTVLGGRLPLSLFRALGWLPVVLAPLLVLQLWTPEQRLPRRAVLRPSHPPERMLGAWAVETGQARQSRCETDFALVRGPIAGTIGREAGRNLAAAAKPQPPAFLPPRLLDLRAAFVLATLLAAAAANSRSPLFFPLAAALLGMLLWRRRPSRTAALVWGASLALAVSLAFALQLGLSRLQDRIEDSVIEWLTALTLDLQAERAMTRIGSLGRLKQSSAVILRVHPPADAALPIRLMEAAYDRPAGAAWTPSQRAAGEIAAHGDDWPLTAHDAEGPVYRIEALLRGGEGVLPLPLGAAVLEDLRASAVERHAHGAVRVRGAPRFLRFGARTGPAALAPPTALMDLYVPGALRPALDSVAEEIGLSGTTDAARAIGKIEQFFFTRYRYTLDLEGPDGEARDLSAFLLHDRRGHCEYFASAAVLLLRLAGIPARYAVGFAAHEVDEADGSLVVRASDAHAWALAHVNGRWVEVDATPPDWALLEAESAFALRPWWQAVMAWRFDLERLLAEHLAALPVPYVMALVAALMLVLVTLLARRLRRSATRVAKMASAPEAVDHGELSALVRTLERWVPRRGPTETLSSWVRRAVLHPGIVRHDDLHQAVALAYRAQFDPDADSAAVNDHLRAAAQDWVRAQTDRSRRP